MTFDERGNTDYTDAMMSTFAALSRATPAAPPTLRSVRPPTGECKTCSSCGKRQDLCEFAIKRGARATRCRACQKVLSDEHYRLHRVQRIADAAVRNTQARLSLADRRDAYLERCACEACNSTVDLRLTTAEGYDGLSMHEVVGAAGSAKKFTEALKNSQVLCGYCMGHKYGTLGGLAKAAIRVSAATAGPSGGV